MITLFWIMKYMCKCNEYVKHNLFLNVAERNYNDDYFIRRFIFKTNMKQQNKWGFLLSSNDFLVLHIGFSSDVIIWIHFESVNKKNKKSYLLKYKKSLACI